MCLDTDFGEHYFLEYVATPLLLNCDENYFLEYVATPLLLNCSGWIIF